MAKVTKSIAVGTIEELKQKGHLSVAAQGHDIVVFYNEGDVYALDNRCPHMGFPLTRGSTKDGILTCDWHHARFDLKTGGCFDLWADDVPVFQVNIINDKIFVLTEQRRQGEELRAYHLQRLSDGMEQNIGLIIAKSILVLFSEGMAPLALFKKGLEHGTKFRQEGWTSGLTILTCMMNIAAHCTQEDKLRGLYHGLSAVSNDCFGQPPRFQVAPLPQEREIPDIVTLKRWFRHFVEVRDRDGAERCLVTAIRAGTESDIIADILFAAATDHRFLDSGHVLDFTNKAFESLDMAGWEMAEQILTSLVPLYAQASRMEETSSWRHPVDIVELLQASFERLPGALQKGKGRRGRWKAKSTMQDTLLGDKPDAIVEVLIQSLEEGAKPEELATWVAYAAALRIARFPTTNEYSDWDTALHTFTFANAMQKALRRLPSSIELLRGVFDAAMSNYLNRFLNVPVATLPVLTKGNHDYGDKPMDVLLEVLDKRQQVNEAAKIVVSHLSSTTDDSSTFPILFHALLREDRSFHTIQMLDATLSLTSELKRLQLIEDENDDNNNEFAVVAVIAAARYLAAHTPTARSQGQIFDIAWRLHQGGKLYEEIT
jgi:nitrite reductase/ring-hydroxylating ferredoxin subunit